MPDNLTAILGGTGIFVAIITCISIALPIILIIVIRRRVGPNRQLLQQGTPGEATILGVQQTGMYVNNQPQAKLTLEVRVPGWEAYQAETKMIIPMVNIPQFQPGAVFPVKVDPNDRNKVVLDVYG